MDGRTVKYKQQLYNSNNNRFICYSNSRRFKTYSNSKHFKTCKDSRLFKLRCSNYIVIAQRRRHATVSAIH